MPAFRRGRTGASGFLRLGRAFPLLQQPAREHGCGIFLDPKVEERANFLAKIGGMTKTGEFKALQRVARGREKELPRRLSLEVVHAGLLGERLLRLTFRKIESRVLLGYEPVKKCAKFCRSGEEIANRRDVQGAVYPINGAGGGNELRACSACAGDYEDPDRTAWTADETDAEECEEPPNKTTQGFPAEE